MKRIWKYPLRISDRQIIRLPIHAKILSVLVRDGDLDLYAAIDDQYEETWDHIIRIAGTNHIFKDLDDCIFLDTVFIAPLVWHVFEKKENDNNKRKI